MYQKIKKFLHTYWLVILLICAGVFFRLYRLNELFHFTYDEEVFAFVGKRMFVNGHIPLIGGVTPFHVHVAPYFYWLSGFILFLSKLNPIGWGIAATVLAGITMTILYITGKELFNKYVGLFAVFLYSFSFYQNIFDRHYWGLVFDGVISLITLFSLFKVFNGRHIYLYILTFVLAFGIHTDLSMLVLIVLTGLSFFYFKPIIPKKIRAGSLLIFFLSFAPLLLFDIRHNFVNSKGILQYMDEVQSGKRGVVNTTVFDSIMFLPRALTRTLYVFNDTNLATQYSYCPHHATGRLQSVPFVATGFTVSLFLFMIFYKKRSVNEQVGTRLISVLLLSTYLGTTLYGVILKGDLFDHYLGTLFPVFYLIVGIFIYSLYTYSSKLALAVILIFAFLNIRLLFYAEHRFGYQDKIAAVDWVIEKKKGEDFSLDVIGDCFSYNGYRYLFYLRGHEPAKSYVDANFTHLYDVPPAINHPKTLVVFTNPDFVLTDKYLEEYDRYLTKTTEKIRFGNIEVLIIDNSNLDFVGKF